MAYFPIILYPKPVTRLFKAVDKAKNKLPPAPLTRLRQVRNIPLTAKNSNQFIKLRLTLSMSLIILVIGVLFTTSLPGWMLSLVWLNCSTMIILVGQKVYQNEFYKESLTVVKAQLIQEHDKQCDVYRKACEDWLKVQTDYKRALYNYRQTIQEEISKSLILPIGYSDAQQGAAEAQFKVYLDKYFPGRIQQSLKFPIPGSDLSYSADFAYVDPAQTLYIDIEIDEPYYYKNNSPTHCCDDETDSNRNNFFLAANWIVIRFAEEQIVCYPNRCCQVIAKVVAEITGEEAVLAKFKDISGLKPIKQWTTATARKMARKKYRDKYLRKF